MMPQDVQQIETEWTAILRQYRRVNEFMDYLRDQPDDPDYDELDARTARALLRLNELSETFLLWIGPARAPQYFHLLHQSAA